MGEEQISFSRPKRRRRLLRRDYGALLFPNFLPSKMTSPSKPGVWGQAQPCLPIQAQPLPPHKLGRNKHVKIRGEVDQGTQMLVLLLEGEDDPCRHDLV